MGTALPKKLTLRTWWLSTELRRLREAAGLNIAAVVRHTGISRATLQRTEAGDTVPHPRNLLDLLRLYRAPDHERAMLVDLAGQPDASGWWNAHREALPEDYGVYIEFEALAAHLRNYEASYVPGIVQTPNYAEAVIRGSVPGIEDDEVARRVEVRRQRQNALTAPDPLTVHAVVDESAIRRVVGGPAVMREQLRALTQLPPTVTLQVVPYGVGAHPGMSGPFSIMRFRPERAPQAVFVESGAGQLFLDSEVDLSRYHSMWNRLTDVALNPEETARLIAEAARKMR